MFKLRVHRKLLGSPLDADAAHGDTRGCGKGFTDATSQRHAVAVGRCHGRRGARSEERGRAGAAPGPGQPGTGSHLPGNRNRNLGRSRPGPPPPARGGRRHLRPSPPPGVSRSSRPGGTGAGCVRTDGRTRCTASPGALRVSGAGRWGERAERALGAARLPDGAARDGGTGAAAERAPAALAPGPSVSSTCAGPVGQSGHGTALSCAPGRLVVFPKWRSDVMERLKLLQFLVP